MRDTLLPAGAPELVAQQAVPAGVVQLHTWMMRTHNINKHKQSNNLDCRAGHLQLFKIPMYNEKFYFLHLLLGKFDWRRLDNFIVLAQK